MKIIPERILPEITLAKCGKQCPHIYYIDSCGWDDGAWHCHLAKDKHGGALELHHYYFIDGFPKECPLKDKEE